MYAFNALLMIKILLYKKNTTRSVPQDWAEFGHYLETLAAHLRRA